MDSDWGSFQRDGKQREQTGENVHSGCIFKLLKAAAIVALLVRVDTYGCQI